MNESAVEKMKEALRLVKRSLIYKTEYHDKGDCAGWNIRMYGAPLFTVENCNCAIGEILYKIEMLEEYL